MAINRINRITVERGQCAICDIQFVQRATTIDNEPELYCSERCAFFALDVREMERIIAQTRTPDATFYGVWNPLLSTYEPAS